MDSLKKVWQVLREQGFASLLARVLRKILPEPRRLLGSAPIRLLVATEDASEVDWSVPHPAVVNPISLTKKSLTISWIISPPGESSGGHQNIFRFMSFLEAAGHTIRIYLYSAHAPFTVSTIKERLAHSPSYPRLDASIEAYTSAGVSVETDVIFATGWETAYASFRDASPARRLYFVQDYEPYFFPVGSASVLAENTYRFGFHGITAGSFLARKLSTDFGMPTSHYDFGVNRQIYHFVEKRDRREVFFYARPPTERRGFELGIMALAEFAKARPEYTINLAGWDVKPYRIPFAYKNLKDLKVDQLNEVYNRCAAALVISLTNMSLLPLELLSAGVIPVLNDGPNNRLVSDNPFIEYSACSPKALAAKLIDVVDRSDLRQHARAASESVREKTWEASGQVFLSLFEEAVRD